MKIIVSDRELIESGIIVRSSYIVVSIHDPEKRPARRFETIGAAGGAARCLPRCRAGGVDVIADGCEVDDRR